MTNGRLQRVIFFIFHRKVLVLGDPAEHERIAALHSRQE
jgi:hypothetical protein